MSSGNKRMTAAIAFGVGQRTAQWLRAQWPNDTAKNVARALQTEPRTVKTWLAGKPPSNEFFHAMVAKWGKDFISFVYQPHFDWAEQARLEVEIETIQSRLDELREKVRPRDATPQNDARHSLSTAGEQIGASRDGLAAQSRKIDP
jgi:hypothetical protein